MTQELETQPPAKVVDVFDRVNPESVLNLVPPVVQAAFLAANRAHPDLFQLDERDLFQFLRSEEKSPTPTDNRLRLSFWLEYDRVMSHGGKFNVTNVFAGVCTRHYFYGSYLESPTRLAWLLCPPVKYMIKIEEALDYGLDRLRELLALNPVMVNGKVDSKLASIQVKIVEMLDNRSKGAVLQKTIGLQVHTGDKQIAAAVMGQTMEAMEARLKQIEKMERSMTNQNLPDPPEEPKDVPNEPV